MCETKQEIWLPVVGRESYYEVSNTGKVRSLVGRYKSKPVFELKQYINKHGYCFVDLTFPVRRKELVHRLVASAFLSNAESYPVVNHLDNNPSNNAVENLEWTTYSGNLLHAQAQGRLFEAQSKGGRAQAVISTAELLADAASMVGQQYGEWTVLSIDRIRKYGNVNRPMLLCRCACGAEVSVCRINLKKGQSTCCKSCSARKLSKSVQKEIVERYSGKPFYHWTFTGNSNIDQNLTTKSLKLEGVCGCCGYIQSISYAHLASDNRKFSCKKCKTQKT